MDQLDEKAWLARVRGQQHPAQKTYRAMYSTWWQGIVSDAHLMMVPVDDHQVHRGDAVFEALKFVDRRIYLATEHLNRMEASARSIGLTWPLRRDQIENVMAETVRASGLSSGLLRLFLSRGPGLFSTNPYDSVGPQFHVIVTEGKTFSDAKYEAGVSLGQSQIVVKDGFFARIKSCNYLPNVLMKKEAVDRGLDFTVGVDGAGFLTEGSTENLMIVDAEGALCRPRAEGILAGTTMGRAFELAAPLLADGTLSASVSRDLSVEDLLRAREVMMAGTTLDVIAVSSFENKSVGGGRCGPVAQELRRLLIQDQQKGDRVLLAK